LRIGERTYFWLFPAAQKRHRVTLWEKGNELGGQLILATIPPEKQALITLLNYLKV